MPTLDPVVHQFAVLDVPSRDPLYPYTLQLVGAKCTTEHAHKSYNK